MRRYRTLSSLATLALICLLILGCQSSESGPPPLRPAESPPAAPGDIVAEAQGFQLTLTEVEERVRRDAPATFQAIFDARVWAIDQLVEERLLAEAAAEIGVTPDALLQREVAERLEPVDDAAVKAFYEANSKAMRGTSFDEVKDGLRQRLERQEAAAKRLAYMISLKEAAGFKLYLEPPRYNVVMTEHDRAKGPADAAVTIVEYADFQCPFCVQVAPTLARIQEEYGGTVRFVYRDLPLRIHEDARPAAEAGHCAHAQGRFWEFHDKAFESPDRLKPDDLKLIASEIGLDMDAFDACVESRRFETAVAQEEEGGVELGITGTPTFFVNGRILSGAVPFERFAELIEDELRRQ